MKQLNQIEEMDIAETIESIPMPMASFRVESPTRFVLHADNQALRDLLKTDGDKAYGRTIVEIQFTSKNVLQQIQRIFELAVSTGKTQNVERPVKLRDASRIVLNYTAIPLIINDEVKFIVTTNRDTTEIVNARRKRQAELTQLASVKFAVCAWCSSVRDKDDSWLKVERYVKQNAFQRPKQTLCPDCIKHHEAANPHLTSPGH